MGIAGLMIGLVVVFPTCIFLAAKVAIDALIPIVGVLIAVSVVIAVICIILVTFFCLVESDEFEQWQRNRKKCSLRDNND